MRGFDSCYPCLFFKIKRNIRIEPAFVATRRLVEHAYGIIKKLLYKKLPSRLRTLQKNGAAFIFDRRKNPMNANDATADQFDAVSTAGCNVATVLKFITLARYVDLSKSAAAALRDATVAQALAGAVAHFTINTLSALRRLTAADLSRSRLKSFAPTDLSYRVGTAPVRTIFNRSDSLNMCDLNGDLTKTSRVASYFHYSAIFFSELNDSRPKSRRVSAFVLTGYDKVGNELIRLTRDSAHLGLFSNVTTKRVYLSEFSSRAVLNGELLGGESLLFSKKESPLLNLSVAGATCSSAGALDLTATLRPGFIDSRRLMRGAMLKTPALPSAPAHVFATSAAVLLFFSSAIFYKTGAAAISSAAVAFSLVREL